MADQPEGRPAWKPDRKMLVTISEMSQGSDSWFVGTVHIHGLSPTKLLPSTRTSPRFRNKDMLKYQAMKLGEFLGLEVIFRDDGSSTAQP